MTLFTTEQEFNEYLERQRVSPTVDVFTELEAAESASQKYNAHIAVSSGFHVFALKPRQKEPDAQESPEGFHSSTNDPSRIEDIWTRKPTDNIGIDCGASDVCVLDFDKREQIPDWIARLKTRKVETSRGLHVYFRGARPSTQMFNSAGEHIGEIKSAGGYVLAAGSVHPDGSTYRVVDDSPIANAPEEIVTLTKRPVKASASINGDRIPYGQHDTELTRIAGKLREAGMEEESLNTTLIEVCEKRCDNYGDDYREMCQKIAKSVCRYPVGKDMRPRIGGRIVGQTTEPMDVSKWQDNFKSVGELEAGDVRMLIRNFLPEGTCFLGGLPGEGKTLLALSITKALTTGKNFLARSDFDVPAITPVIYLIPESGSRAFRKRCEKFHIPDDRTRFICRTISEGSTLRLDDPTLIEAVRTMRPVIVLDTLIRFSDSSDENSATQNRTLADAVIRLRQEGAVAVIGLHHSTKAMRQSGMSLENVLRGSNDIAACADAVYGILRNDRVYDHGAGPLHFNIECVKPRDFDPPAPFTIAAERKVDRNVIGRRPGIVSNIDSEGDFVIVDKEEIKADRDAELITIIQEDPNLTVKEISDATGISQWKVSSTLKNLGWVKSRGGRRRSHQWVKVTEGDGAAAEVILDLEPVT